LNFTQLRYFAAVARSRSLTRAAAELRVAQPAISRQIKLLEEELGTPLLSRHHRGVELTDAGLLLQQRSEFLVRTLEETRIEIMDLSAEPAGELRLGCPPSLTRRLIAKALQRFLSRYPRVRVRLREAMSDHLCQLVVSDQLDMAIISVSANESHLERTPLYPEAIWLFGPPGTLNRRTPITLAAVAKLPMLLSMPSNATRTLLESRMREAGLKPKVLVETDSIAVVHELIENGIGYAAAPFTSHQDLV
jgi:LysR family nitrogen assimilation transcriptional regulator